MSVIVIVVIIHIIILGSRLAALNGDFPIGNRNNAIEEKHILGLGGLNIEYLWILCHNRNRMYFCPFTMFLIQYV